MQSDPSSISILEGVTFNRWPPLSCKECDRVRDRAYKAKHHEEMLLKGRVRRRANPERDREYQSKYRRRNRARDLIRHARTRADRKSIECDLLEHLQDVQARIDAGVCELTGVPFNLGEGRTFDSPSIDRIDPTRGYTYDNIRIICHAMNSALGDWGEEKLLEILRLWEKHRRNAIEQGKGNGPSTAIRR